MVPSAVDRANLGIAEVKTVALEWRVDARLVSTVLPRTAERRQRTRIMVSFSDGLVGFSWFCEFLDSDELRRLHWPNAEKVLAGSGTKALLRSSTGASLAGRYWSLLATSYSCSRSFC